MERRREPGCRSAADQQPEPRNGYVQMLPHGRRNQGGRLDDRPFLADGRAGSDAPCRGKTFRAEARNLISPFPMDMASMYSVAPPRHPFLQEQQNAAGHQAARHRNKHAPFRLHQEKVPTRESDQMPVSIHWITSTIHSKNRDMQEPTMPTRTAHT